MKRLLLTIATALTMHLSIFSQTYSAMWRQVKEAEDKDLPQTEQKLLRQIAEKAEREQAWGQLLKAELQEARSMSQVAPASCMW